ncbi:hypothetical protein SELMODRAFT_136412, partial [Selaginella moellendorffii]
IPPYMVAEAMSSLHGLDLRWSSPITPTEMQYVEQYVKARYPEFFAKAGDARNLPVLTEDQEYIDENGRNTPGAAGPDEFKRKSPSAGQAKEWGVKKMPLEQSRLLDILTQKATSIATYTDSLSSIPEIHARNTLLRHLGVTDEDYLVVFTSSLKESMMMVGESYPFCRYMNFMTVLSEEVDWIREFASYKEAKVIVAPSNWLNLRIAGSQLSQNFRRKSKQQSPNLKGLFAFPAAENGGTRNSLHWVSEAQRNSWHVLLDASNLRLCDDQLNLTFHKPDYVLCTLSGVVGHSTTMTCLLVRRSSFGS